MACRRLNMCRAWIYACGCVYARCVRVSECVCEAVAAARAGSLEWRLASLVGCLSLSRLAASASRSLACTHTHKYSSRPLLSLALLHVESMPGRHTRAVFPGMLPGNRQPKKLLRLVDARFSLAFLARSHAFSSPERKNSRWYWSSGGRGARWLAERASRLVYLYDSTWSGRCRVI